MVNKRIIGKASDIGRCDSHVHTSLCNHASGTMEEYVQAAIQAKLSKIIFLEHMEEGIVTSQKTWLSDDDFDHYFAEGEELREKYCSQIEIGLGVECGYNPNHSEKLLLRLRKRCWAQVGISCHFLWLEEEKQHLNMLSRKQDSIDRARRQNTDLIFTRYFDLLLEGVQKLPGTMLCHIDAPLRFLPEATLKESHYQQIDTLLQVVEDQGMGVEINSSGFPIRGEQFPRKEILSRVYNFSIPIVFGSDAHRPEDVGQYFDKLTTLLP